MEDCSIKNTGTYGLEISGPGNRIVGNEIYDTGSGGIIARNYTSEHNVVAYNYIHHVGRSIPAPWGSTSTTAAASMPTT